ncbi:glucocorticoid receptor DNA-binding factor 1 [Pelomyxa schiedti]|nr:glucocorticoid receptor DNA-binding factor 1 [Pelomyxa schiedti]
MKRIVLGPQRQTQVACWGLPKDPRVPLVVTHCCAWLDERGPKCKGIFRVPGNSALTTKLKNLYIQGHPQLQIISKDMYVDGDHVSDYEVASLLCTFLRDLPDSILTSSLQGEFAAALLIEDRESKISKMNKLIKKLPPGNFAVLRRILQTLEKISLDTSINLMTPVNLGTCVGPAILRAEPQLDINKIQQAVDQAKDLLTFLIENNQELFKDPTVCPPSADQVLSDAKHLLSADVSNHDDGVVRLAEICGADPQDDEWRQSLKDLYSGVQRKSQSRTWRNRSLSNAFANPTSMALTPPLPCLDSSTPTPTSTSTPTPTTSSTSTPEHSSTSTSTTTSTGTNIVADSSSSSSTETSVTSLSVTPFQTSPSRSPDVTKAAHKSARAHHYRNKSVTHTQHANAFAEAAAAGAAAAITSSTLALVNAVKAKEKAVQAESLLDKQTEQSKVDLRPPALEPRSRLSISELSSSAILTPTQDASHLHNHMHSHAHSHRHSKSTVHRPSTHHHSSPSDASGLSPPSTPPRRTEEFYCPSSLHSSTEVSTPSIIVTTPPSRLSASTTPPSSPLSASSTSTTTSSPAITTPDNTTKKGVLTRTRSRSFADLLSLPGKTMVKSFFS